MRPTAIGAFDADGNWCWSTQWPRKKNENGVVADEDATGLKEDVSLVLNRHDRAQIIMTGSMDGLSGQRKRPDQVRQRGLKQSVTPSKTTRTKKNIATLSDSPPTTHARV